MVRDGEHVKCRLGLEPGSVFLRGYSISFCRLSVILFLVILGTVLEDGARAGSENGVYDTTVSIRQDMKNTAIVKSHGVNEGGPAM